MYGLYSIRTVNRENAACTVHTAYRLLYIVRMCCSSIIMQDVCGVRRKRRRRRGKQYLKNEWNGIERSVGMPCQSELLQLEQQQQQYYRYSSQHLLLLLLLLVSMLVLMVVSRLSIISLN